MKRSATASWHGGIKDGSGNLTTDSGALSSIGYSFSTRFEDKKGTNPEELIAAAHAGCYSMALSLILGEYDVTPEKIDTKATVNIEKKEEGFEITDVHLDVNVTAEGIDEKVFKEATEKGKAGCPVSKVLNAEISLDAKLSD